MGAVWEVAKHGCSLTSYKHLPVLYQMTTPYGIRTITEQSIAALLAPYATDPLFTGVQFHAGQIDEVRSVPIVIFQAESAHAHSDFGYNNLGNFEITLKIYVYTSLDDEGLEVHKKRVEAIQAIMQNLTALQSAWTQGHLYVSTIVDDTEGLSDRRFGNVLTFTLVAVYPSA